MHQHLIAFLGFGQAGQAHQLTHASEIHLGHAPEGIVPGPGWRAWLGGLVWIGCLVWLGAENCLPARGLRSPEGIAFSPDGLNAYVSAYGTGGLAILNRNPSTGGLVQKQAPWGCVSSSSTEGCASGRALTGAGAVAVSPNGRYVYATAAKANAITIFRRNLNGN